MCLFSATIEALPGAPLSPKCRSSISSTTPGRNFLQVTSDFLQHTLLHPVIRPDIIFYSPCSDPEPAAGAGGQAAQVTGSSSRAAIPSSVLCPSHQLTSLGTEHRLSCDRCPKFQPALKNKGKEMGFVIGSTWLERNSSLQDILKPLKPQLLHKGSLEKKITNFKCS